MYAPADRQQNNSGVHDCCRPGTGVSVQLLTDEHRGEALDFLAARPLHTFGMTGFIRGNGLVSEHNRGSFYACRDEGGRLEGVALIGHHILFETNSEAAIQAFARLAQCQPSAYMLLGEREKVEIFWHFYASGGRAIRLYGRELLLRLDSHRQTQGEAPGLRLATPDDLDLIVPAHAQTVLDESGIDPLSTEPESFRRRCARRIEQGTTWVWTENGRLMFKAEVVTDTSAVVYLEGVWTNPEDRGKGYGTRCLSHLGATLLEHAECVCLLVNEKFQAAQAFYRKLGYEFVSHYDTIFLSYQ